MGDTFVEQILRRKYTTKDYLILLGLCFALAVILLAGFLFLVPYYLGIYILVVAGSIFGYYKLATLRNLEFEYSFTNGDLTIDKIINRQRRKRLTSFDVKNVEEMGKYDAAKLEHRQFDKRLMVGSQESGKDCWYLAYRSPKTGHTLIVFEPNEKVLDAIKLYLPRQIKVDVFGH